MHASGAVASVKAAQPQLRQQLMEKASSAAEAAALLSKRGRAALSAADDEPIVGEERIVGGVWV